MAHLIGAMMDGAHPQTTKQEINLFFLICYFENDFPVSF
jgi:hypothetical protein